MRRLRNALLAGQPYSVTRHSKSIRGKGNKRPASAMSEEGTTGSEKQSPSHHERLTVVLDMDETLIHSQVEVVGADESMTAYDPRQAEDRPASGQGSSVEGSHDFEFTIPINQVDPSQGFLRVKVRKRPGLDSFLEEASSFCNLAVFTAGTEDYAKVLLDLLDPCGRMSLRLFRDSCSVLDGLFLKDLKKVDHDLSRVVLVDNSPVSLLINPDNSILVSSFYANPDDSALGQLLPILRKLHHAGDVRDTLAKEFQLREALEQSGWDLEDIRRRHEQQMCDHVGG